MRIISDFRDFAMKGNVVDLAIAFIMGGAFGTIVTSLVNDILMPPIGLALGGVDFSALVITLKEASADAETGEPIAAVTWNYGNFIQTLINFLVVAFAMFLLIKGMVKIQRKKDATPAAPPPPSNEEKLLTEIRDALRNR